MRFDAPRVSSIAFCNSMVVTDRDDDASTGEVLTRALLEEMIAARARPLLAKCAYCARTQERPTDGSCRGCGAPL